MAIKRQSTIVGRLQREVTRKMSALGAAVQEMLGDRRLAKAGWLIEQASILMRANGVRPEAAYADLGDRGVDRDRDNSGIEIEHRGKFKSLTAEERALLKRRQAIEPMIGHLDADHRMNRCHLKGTEGDSLHSVLCAAGYNIRWLLRMII